MTNFVIMGDHGSLMHVHYSCMGYTGFLRPNWSQWVIMAYWCMYIGLVCVTGASYDQFGHNG
jgi:hypothetical protein